MSKLSVSSVILMSAIKPKQTFRFEYLYVLQGYFQGWEDLHATPLTKDGFKEIRSAKDDYRTNAPGSSYRIIQRREPKSESI